MEKFIIKQDKLIKYQGQDPYVKIPNTIKEIKQLAFFSHQYMKKIEISKSVVKIEKGTFDFCNELENIVVDEENSVYKSVAGCLYNKNIDMLIRYPVQKDNSIYKVLDSVITIDNDAFNYCINLEEVILPKVLKKLNNSAFQDCKKLVKIDLPDSLEIIKDYVFFGCERLHQITIPKNVKSIGNNVFNDCVNLKEIVILGSPEIADFSLSDTENVRIIAKELVKEKDFYWWKDRVGEDKTYIIGFENKCKSDILEHSKENYRDALSVLLKYNRLDLLERFLSLWDRINKDIYDEIFSIIIESNNKEFLEQFKKLILR